MINYYKGLCKAPEEKQIVHFYKGITPLLKRIKKLPLLGSGGPHDQVPEHISLYPTIQ